MNTETTQKIRELLDAAGEQAGRGAQGLAQESILKAVRMMLGCIEYPSSPARAGNARAICNDLHGDPGDRHPIDEPLHSLYRPATCTCRKIMSADPLRHFRGCPDRKPLPADHPEADAQRSALARASWHECIEADAKLIEALIAKLDEHDVALGPDLWAQIDAAGLGRLGRASSADPTDARLVAPPA